MNFSGEIQEALSAERFGRYLTACHNHEDKALNLYNWNMAVSGAFLPWLSIAEVVFRNRIHQTLEQVHGSEWPWAEGFERSLSQKGFPLIDLEKSRNKYRKNRQTGKVVADLKFAFWQHLLTKKYELPLWNKNLYFSFPNLDQSLSVGQNRKLIYDTVEHLRMLRNRIAHHEPIFDRNLLEDYQQILKLIRFSQTQDFVSWLQNNQKVNGVNTTYLEALLMEYPH